MKRVAGNESAEARNDSLIDSFILKANSDMSDQDNGNAWAETDIAAETEGEPHPADLLASLMRADSGLPAAKEKEPAREKEPVREKEMPAPSAEPFDEESLSGVARALAAQPGMQQEMQAIASDDPTAMQRTMAAVRNALPVLQKLLPLLDGNILGAILNMLTPHPQAQPPQKPVDFTPVENNLTELKKQYQELKGQFQVQDGAIKRLAEQLEQVRDATERNTREQEDLVDELKVSGKRMNIVAFMAFALLAASIAMNVVLYLQIHRLLP